MRDDPNRERPIDETRRLLSLHLDGELDAARRADLDARIDASEALQAELAFWKRFRERLADDGAATDDLPAPASVADRVMATIGARNREVAAVLPFIRRLSAAAAIVLVAAGAVLGAIALRPDPESEALHVQPRADLDRSLLAPAGHVALIGGIKLDRLEDGAGRAGDGR